MKGGQKKMEKNKEENIVDKSFNGLLIVKARNGNFNSDFDGNPRTLPDGRIFATDKALKYCIREYLATFKDEPVFVRRNRYMKEIKTNGSEKKEGKEKNKIKRYAYDTLEENYNNKFELVKEKFKEMYDLPLDKKLEKIWEDKNILEILKEFLDIRLLGVVFSPKGKGKNISLTGPVQITYGMNNFENSSSYPLRILSPYRNEQDKKEIVNTTTGEETRADEVYYIYNIVVNSTNAKQTGMTYKDLEKLKEALLNSVDSITSCTKFGCESIALIWLNNKENLVLKNLDEFVSIKKNKNKDVELNIEKLEEFLKQYGFDSVKKTQFVFKDFDYSEKAENKNKIEVIYKTGKIVV
jgi:CRISPR-associated protein Csh2